ncbi:MAG: histidine--tRNA ligase [bacterium]|nr:histidine--tRNA ligase [bacterium]
MTNQAKLNLSPLAGMAEWLPSEQIEFEKFKNLIRETYALYGFSPIETPVLERQEILLAKAGGETEKQIYQFAKGDSLLAMRFDLTVPLARYVANYQNDLVFPFRRQAMERVYRGERAQRGRFREFYQADADIIGRETLDLRYDAEIISLIAATFGRLNLGAFLIRINNRKLVSGFLQAMKIMDAAEVLQILDKAEKIGEKKMRQELSLLRLDGLEIRKIMQFAQIRGDISSVVQALLRLDLANETFSQGIEELQTVAQILPSLGVPADSYTFDCSIIRGLDYYTGTIFETKIVDAPALGSVCSGGRYENLVGNFAKTKMPGVGMSIGLTRLFFQLKEMGWFDFTQKTISQIVVLPLTQNLAEVLKIAAQLRENDIATEVYLQEAGLKKKLKYANDLGILFALFVGDDELATQTVVLKNMLTGEQENLKLAQVINRFNA